MALPSQGRAVLSDRDLKTYAERIRDADLAFTVFVSIIVAPTPSGAALAG